MSQIKIVSFKFFIFFLLLMCYSGCSDKKKQPTVSTVIHSENWIEDHKTGYLAFKEKTGCTNCHGVKCDGGNAQVSCFSTSFEGLTCHEQHPDGWKKFTSHGKAAKYDSTKGLPACQKCHGQDFQGGIVNVACFSCHGVSAPHPRAPWNNKYSDDTTNTTSVTIPMDTTTIRPIHHAKTSPMPLSNLTVCFGCHEDGKYSRKKPNPAIPKGEGLECGNNTICHSKKW